MAIDLQCACGQRLHFDIELAGERVACSACGRALDLPTAEELAAPPQPVVEVVAAPPYRLASPGQIGVAAFLGGPLAGFLLMARNCANHGRLATCWVILLVGVLITVAVVGLGFVIPESKGRSQMLLAILLWIGTYLVAKGLFQRSFAEHRGLGGRQASIGTILGSIVLGIGLTFGAAYGMAEVEDALLADRRLQVTPQEEIIYSHDVTDVEARALGRVLQEHGYFDGASAKSVRLSKDRSEYVLQCVLGSGFDEPSVHFELRTIAHDLSQAFGGAWVRTELCDRNLKPKKTLDAVRAK